MFPPLTGYQQGVVIINGSYEVALDPVRHQAWRQCAKKPWCTVTRNFGAQACLQTKICVRSVVQTTTTKNISISTLFIHIKKTRTNGNKRMQAAVSGSTQISLVGKWWVQRTNRPTKCKTRSLYFPAKWLINQYQDCRGHANTDPVFLKRWFLD